MKKVVSILLAALMVAAVCMSLTACESKKDTFTVGVCQLVPHAALDAATQGFEDALKEKFGEKVTVDV